MWLSFNELDRHHMAFLAALGRAIAVAQNLEENCRFVLMTVELGKAFEEKRYSSLEEARPFVDRLLRALLGPVVKRIGEIGEVSQKEVDTLVAAKMRATTLS